MCEILGVGIDLCGITRMEKCLDKEHFMERVFTPGEIAYIRAKGRSAAASMAGIFAVKEAVCKALGTGIAFALTEIEVTHTEAGQPQVSLTGCAAEIAGNGRFQVSISHEGDMAAALAVWMK